MYLLLSLSIFSLAAMETSGQLTEIHFKPGLLTDTEILRHNIQQLPAKLRLRVESYLADYYHPRAQQVLDSKFLTAGCCDICGKVTGEKPSIIWGIRPPARDEPITLAHASCFQKIPAEPMLDVIRSITPSHSRGNLFTQAITAIENHTAPLTLTEFVDQHGTDALNGIFYAQGMKAVAEYLQNNG